MKFSQDSGAGGYQVVSYDTGLVVVEKVASQGGADRRARTELRRSGLLAPDRVIEGWGPRSVAELCMDDFSAVFGFAPELLLLGTGASLIFPSWELQREVLGRDIGLEVMDTRAACRTYNVLMMEGRKVMAALLL